MYINWQDVFYFTGSLAMIMFVFAGIAIIWSVVWVARSIRQLVAVANRWKNVADDVRYLQQGIKYRILSFLLKIIDKGGHNVERRQA